jgi:hypothetical protein
MWICGLGVPFLIRNANVRVGITNYAYGNFQHIVMDGVTNGVESFSDASWTMLTDITGNANLIGYLTHDGAKLNWYLAPALTGTAGDFSEDGGVTLRLNAALVDGAFFSAANGSKIYRRD